MLKGKVKECEVCLIQYWSVVEEHGGRKTGAAWEAGDEVYSQKAEVSGGGHGYLG